MGFNELGRSLWLSIDGNLQPDKQTVLITTDDKQRLDQLYVMRHDHALNVNKARNPTVVVTKLAIGQEKRDDVGLIAKKLTSATPGAG